MALELFSCKLTAMDRPVEFAIEWGYLGPKSFHILPYPCSRNRTFYRMLLRSAGIKKGFLVSGFSFRILINTESQSNGKTPIYICNLFNPIPSIHIILILILRDTLSDSFFSQFPTFKLISLYWNTISFSIAIVEIVNFIYLQLICWISSSSCIAIYSPLWLKWKAVKGLVIFLRNSLFYLAHR